MLKAQPYLCDPCLDGPVRRKMSVFGFCKPFCFRTSLSVSALAGPSFLESVKFSKNQIFRFFYFWTNFEKHNMAHPSRSSSESVPGHNTIIKHQKPQFLMCGSRGRSRTADLRVMNPALSPTELPCHGVFKRFKTKKLGCGGRIRTADLRVMSPTSCHCSTPRR